MMNWQMTFSTQRQVEFRAPLYCIQELSWAVESAIADLRTNTSPKNSKSRLTRPRQIIVGGAGHNVYTNEAFLIIDTAAMTRT